VKIKTFFRSVFSSVRLACISGDQLGKNASPAMVDVIISLTSIPSRLSALHLTIKSLLNQGVSFEKIVLWLHQDLKDNLPTALQNLQDDWLLRLLESWQHTPDDIVAHRCRKILIENGEIMPYASWHSESTGGSSALTIAVGWGGILYPPGSLDDRVLDRDTYMRLSPKADDLWYKAMATLKGTAVRKSRNPYPAPIPIIASQGISLRKKNIGEDLNRVQFLALVKEYNLTFEE
jgi:hypothetical protein